MITKISEIEAWLSGQLAEVQIGIRDNIFQAEAVKNQLALAFREIRSDMARRGVQDGTPHWDLLMADWNSDEDAVFIIAAFDEPGLTLMVGRTDKARVIEICRKRGPSEASDSLDDLKSVAAVYAQCLVERSTGDDWLGMSG